MNKKLRTFFALAAIALALLPQAGAQVFGTPDAFNPGTDGSVYSLALQADGKILVGGYFGALGGESRTNIGRLNADGTLDTSFNPGADRGVQCLAVLADGKILVGGYFGALGGRSRANIGRLNADGTLDTSFNPGTDGDVESLAVQADGKILVAGYFSTLGGQSRNYIGRLNADGTLDPSFNPGTDGSVYSLALQADGKILVGGYFGALGGESRTNIGRLNADGTLDTSFNPGADRGVLCLAVLADGKILVGGYFGALGGRSRANIGRLNVDGTLDTSFNPGTDGDVESLALQADGKILVGGLFGSLGGQSRNHIGRLNADGTLDAGFNPGADFDLYVGGVNSLAVQADGKILVGGQFVALGGQSRNSIGRLNNTDPAIQNLTFDGSTLTWTRGGTSPEVWLTTFDYSSDGASWTSLGSGTRILGLPPGHPGSWQLTGIALPINTTFRARGYVAGGAFLGSDWFVESYLGSPGVYEQPASLTNKAGTTATFRIYAAGSGPLSYHWRANGANLADGGNVSGALAATLTLSNVLGGDAAGYSVIIANAAGSVTSAVATLTVIEPVINLQPVSQAGSAGDIVVFSVEVAGTPPVNYQWRANGTNLADGGNVSGAATTTLTLRNVLHADAGSYSVIIANAAGSVTSAVATLTVVDPVIILHPVSQARNPGESVTFIVGVAGTPPLNYQWRHNGGLQAGATQSSLTLTNLQAADAGSYDVVVSDAWGSVTSAVAFLSEPAPDSLNPGTDGYVYSLALQADGKILVGGWFTTLGGQSRANIGRLNADGTLDTSFNPGAASSGGYGGQVYSLALQADGKILAGGAFDTLGGQSRNFFGRLNADGTLDTSFNPGAASSGGYGGQVYSLALQADGKILAGGAFDTLGGQSRNGIGRLNANGTLDTSFNPGTRGYVYCLALQPDGKILVGGAFTTLGGQSRDHFGRLNADGTLDTSFNPGADSYVFSLAVQADGRILVGGSFAALGGQSRNGIGRLNANGTLDTSFNPGADSDVSSLALQADGMILVGGGFSALGGQSRTNIGRLHADGTLDWSFNPGAVGELTSLALQADGKILVGGAFGTLGGQSRTNIGRLNNTDPAIDSLAFDGSTLTWTRGGTSPEVGRATFEYSPAGGSWTSLGSGTRVLGLPAGPSGSWQLTGLALPINTSFRARGYVAGGLFNGSDWVVESYLGPLAVYEQPASLTNNAGATATFSIYAAGSGLLTYHWRANGTNLVDGGNVSGATTATLTLSHVFGGDAGSYSVIIANAAGSVTSAVATLTVIDPVIDLQPVSQIGNAGDNVAFNVGVSGTPPLNYQWRHDGGLVARAAQSSLTFTNLQVSDAGYYDVVVSDAWGSVTSAVAFLSVNLAVPDSFNPGADYFVYSLALQADGKILVGGSFAELGGQSRTNLGRLNADGTLDWSFNPGIGGYVNCLVLQVDDKILVGGQFNTLGGQSRTNIGRLNADGTLDLGFNPGADFGVNGGGVSSLAVQADGKILVGGLFTTLGGRSRANLGRLNADGTLDVGFNPGADFGVSGGGGASLALQADGKILVGGQFNTLGGQSRTNLGRLHADGTLDTSFHPGVDNYVNSLALQADGKILVGGNFSTLGGLSRNHIGRLNADGTLDAGFNPGADFDMWGGVNSLALQADGKILVGGLFTTLGGQSRINLGRLNADGSLDTSFNPGTDYYVGCLALQADGKILVGGLFSTLGGQSRTNIGRLNNSEPATQSLAFDGSTLTWMRVGTSPEVWRATFEYSSDFGNSWTFLGDGLRIGGSPAGQPVGWQLTGVVLPMNSVFRARGYVYVAGSGWFVETVLKPSLAISGVFHPVNGQFEFSASGAAGQVVVIESSPDLRSWLPLRTNTFGAGPISFTDPQLPILPSRFYRVR